MPGATSKGILGAVVALMLVTAGVASVRAQSCTAYPNNLTNGTPADAYQVMANFNSILSCANTNLAPLANPNFAGNVGIGTTNIVGALTVANGTDHNLNIRGDPMSLSLPSGLLGPILQGVNSAQNFNEPITLYGNDIYLMGPGNVGIGTTLPTSRLFVNGSAGGTQPWSSPSDARLKTNVETISDALERVLKLRGVSFNWKPMVARDREEKLDLPIGKRQLGFIAQEVEVVVPEAVNPPKNQKDIYSLRPTDLIPLLVEAIKAQQAEITSMKGEITDLKLSIAQGSKRP